MPDTPRWSKEETHCLWCARQAAGDIQYGRHHDNADHDRDSDACWCMGYCWHGCDPSPDEQEAIVSELRARLEDHADG